MSQRNSEEDVMIKFCKCYEGVYEGTSLVKIFQSCHFNIFGINRRCLRKMPIKKNNEQPIVRRLSLLLSYRFEFDIIDKITNESKKDIKGLQRMSVKFVAY